MTHRRMHSAELKRDTVGLARTSGNLSRTARNVGLNLEATHMTAADRISRPFGLLCITLA